VSLRARSLALLAVLALVLLVPRGMTLGICVCDHRADALRASLDLVARHDSVACHCHDHEVAAASKSRPRRSGGAGVEHVEGCRDCEPFGIDDVGVDYTGEQPSGVSALPPVSLLPACVEPAPRAYERCERSYARAPPDALQRPGHWPSVLPLRI
jgi:hypothetical protein